MNIHWIHPSWSTKVLRNILARSHEYEGSVVTCTKSRKPHTDSPVRQSNQWLLKLSFGRCMVSKSTLQGAFGDFGMDDDPRYFIQTCGMEPWKSKVESGGSLCTCMDRNSMKQLMPPRVLRFISKAIKASSLRSYSQNGWPHIWNSGSHCKSHCTCFFGPHSLRHN